MTGILAVGTDAASSRQCLELASSAPEVWAGAAVHPSATKGWRAEWADEIEALLGEPKVVAVGETGLDHHWDTSFVDDQATAFAAHIRLARKHDKALVIHTRASVEAALDALMAAGPPERLIFHCWSGDAEQLERAIGIGAFVSFAGNVSFKNADDLRAVARRVPADRLLVETDSPYLSPEPRRGKPNRPAHVPLVGAALAAARAVEPAELAATTTANARRVLAIA